MIIKADGMFFLIIVIASLLVGPRARHCTRPSRARRDGRFSRRLTCMPVHKSRMRKQRFLTLEVTKIVNT